MLRDFFLGFIKILILHHDTLGPVYGVEFMSLLSQNGYHLSPGTLYPLPPTPRLAYPQPSRSAVRTT